MMKLEQSHVLRMDHLQVLRCFPKCYDDVPTHKMRCRIRHFQYELKLNAIVVRHSFQMILDQFNIVSYRLDKKHYLYMPEVKLFYFA